MSTDLEFRQDLLEIRLPTISTSNSHSLDTSEGKTGAIEVEKDEEECTTPTSPEYMISRMLTCPPAPKKPRRASASSRRRLSELEFFEIVSRDEVESFFRSSYDELFGGVSNSKAGSKRKRHG